MSVVPLIKVNDVDVTAVVRYPDATFTAQVNGTPGTCTFAVRDLDHTRGFVTGQTVTLDINSNRRWTGFVQSVKRQYSMEVSDTSDPETTARWFLIEGFDNNILFSKRVAYNKDNPEQDLLPPPPEWADSKHPDQWAEDTPSDEIVKFVIENYTDMFDDGVTLEGVDNLGSPVPDMAGGFRAATTVGEFMSLVNALLGGIWYLTPDWVMVHKHVETSTVDLSLSDVPGEDVLQPRDYSFTSDAAAMVNDALVWGTANGVPVVAGVSQIKFARSTDTDSIEAHGLWQTGEFNTAMYKQASVDQRAEAMVYGNDASRHGAHVDRLVCEAMIFTDDLFLGDVIHCRSEAFENPEGGAEPFETSETLDAILPVRRIVITFPTPTEAKFELLLTQELDEPWNVYEYLFPKFKKIKFTKPKPWKIIDLPPVIPGPCAMLDDFENRSITRDADAPEWGQSSLGPMWRVPLEGIFQENGSLPSPYVWVEDGKGFIEAPDVTEGFGVSPTRVRLVSVPAALGIGQTFELTGDVSFNDITHLTADGSVAATLKLRVWATPGILDRDGDTLPAVVFTIAPSTDPNGGINLENATDNDYFLGPTFWGADVIYHFKLLVGPTVGNAKIWIDGNPEPGWMIESAGGYISYLVDTGPDVFIGDSPSINYFEFVLKDNSADQPFIVWLDNLHYCDGPCGDTTCDFSDQFDRTVALNQASAGTPTSGSPDWVVTSFTESEDAVEVADGVMTTYALDRIEQELGPLTGREDWSVRFGIRFNEETTFLRLKMTIANVELHLFRDVVSPSTTNLQLSVGAADSFVYTPMAAGVWHYVYVFYSTGTGSAIAVIEGVGGTSLEADPFTDPLTLLMETRMFDDGTASLSIKDLCIGYSLTESEGCTDGGGASPIPPTGPAREVIVHTGGQDFQTQHSFTPGTLQVWVNGTRTTDFTANAPEGQFHLGTSIDAADVLQVTYVSATILPPSTITGTFPAGTYNSLPTPVAGDSWLFDPAAIVTCLFDINVPMTITGGIWRQPYEDVQGFGSTIRIYADGVTLDGLHMDGGDIPIANFGGHDAHLANILYTERTNAATYLWGADCDNMLIESFDIRPARVDYASVIGAQCDYGSPGLIIRNGVFDQGSTGHFGVELIEIDSPHIGPDVSGKGGECLFSFPRSDNAVVDSSTLDLRGMNYPFPSNPGWGIEFASSHGGTATNNTAFGDGPGSNQHFVACDTNGDDVTVEQNTVSDMDAIADGGGNNISVKDNLYHNVTDILAFAGSATGTVVTSPNTPF